MKSDWHRYNLKRRVADLPAIDEATFTSKIAALSVEDDGARKESKKQTTKKEARRQQKEALYQQKLDLLAMREALDQKRKQVTGVSHESPSDEMKDENQITTNGSQDETVTEEDLLESKIANQVHIPLNTCLFCPTKSNSVFDNLDDNISHMFKFHGLYIPEKNFLVDKEGLIRYLGEKVGLGNVCLACSYQGKNLEAVREHMRKKRHMRIPYEREHEKLEISDYYDFSSTYTSATDNATIDCTSPHQADDEWEDVSDTADDSDELDEGSHESDSIIDLGTELMLPSGAIVGHRSMSRYYRQNLPPDRVLSEGQGTVIAAETRHFLNKHNKQQLTVAKRAWEHQKKREDVNDRRAAKFINNQPHFRDPLLQ